MEIPGCIDLSFVNSQDKIIHVLFITFLVLMLLVMLAWFKNKATISTLYASNENEGE